MLHLGASDSWGKSFEPSLRAWTLQFCTPTPQWPLLLGRI